MANCKLAREDTRTEQSALFIVSARVTPPAPTDKMETWADTEFLV